MDNPHSASTDRDHETRPPGEPPVQGPQAGSAPHERTWAMFCHLAAFSALLRVPLGIIAGPLVVWLIRRKDSAFVDRHGKAAVNFQLSMLAYGVGLLIIGRLIFRSLMVVFAEHGQPAADVLRRFSLASFRAPFGLGIARVYLPILAILVVLDVVCTIVAAVRANAGRHYRYPLAIPFIR